MINKLVYFYRFRDNDGDTSSGMIQMEKRIIDKDDMAELRRVLSEQFYTTVTEIISLNFVCRADDLPSTSDWIIAESIAGQDTVLEAMKDMRESPVPELATGLVAAIIEAIRSAKGTAE